MQYSVCFDPYGITGFVCRQLHVPYFHFNPCLSEKIDLKEVRTEQLVKMILEAKMYCSEMEVSLVRSSVSKCCSESEAMHHSSISNSSRKRNRSVVLNNQIFCNGIN